MKNLLILVIILLLSSCDSSIESSNEASTRIEYFQDSRTNICFAQISSRSADGFMIVSIATVPCSQVQNYLIP